MLGKLGVLTNIQNKLAVSASPHAQMQHISDAELRALSDQTDSALH